MTVVAAWLLALIEKVGLQWLYDRISALIKSAIEVTTTHAASKDQAQQDMNKIEQLPKDATAEQEADAGSDALKHL